jgi:hypothetical protein
MIERAGRILVGRNGTDGTADRAGGGAADRTGAGTTAGIGEPPART